MRARLTLYARARTRARHGCARARVRFFYVTAVYLFLTSYIKKGVIRKWSFWPLLDTPLSDTHKSCRWVVDQLLIKNWSKTDHFWIWSICHVFDHFFNQLLCMSFRWFVHVAYMLRCGKVVILMHTSEVVILTTSGHPFGVSSDRYTQDL